MTIIDRYQFDIIFIEGNNARFDVTRYGSYIYLLISMYFQTLNYIMQSPCHNLASLTLCCSCFIDIVCVVELPS